MGLENKRGNTFTAVSMILIWKIMCFGYQLPQKILLQRAMPYTAADWDCVVTTER